MESIRQVLAVLLVLGCLGGALYWLRSKGAARLSVRGFGRSANRQMRLLEQLRLTPQHSLHMVKVGDKVLLVALSPGGCSVLNTSGVEIQVEDRVVNR
jgi:flagellar biogenesis protein FliO